MSGDNFNACLRIVLKHEGGYVDHPRDPGGATNLGVTIGTYSAWIGRRATKAEMRALTVADVTPIYRKNYWDACGCGAMPAGVDLMVFDPAVNSGPARAKQWYVRGRRNGAVETIRAIRDIRMGFLRSLRHWDAFGKGWSRRVADVSARAEAMARNGLPSATPATTRATMQTEAARAAREAERQRKQGTAIGTASAPVAAAPAAASTDWAVIGLGVAVALALGFLAARAWFKAKNEAAISEAYTAVAKEQGQ